MHHGGPEDRSRDVCARLRQYEHARTGHAMLQLDALPFTASSQGSGLLQDDARDARCFRSAIICAGRFFFARRSWTGASIQRSQRPRAFCWHDCRAFPRTADIFPTGRPASAYLVSLQPTPGARTRVFEEIPSSLEEQL